MAKFERGINGPISGLVGNLVASSWRGKPYLKSRPVRKKEAGSTELANQSSFGSTSTWLSPLKFYFRAGFKGVNPDLWAYQGAKSYLHAHALVSDGTTTVIDPSKMMISQGDLPLGTDFEVYYDSSTSEICVTWNPKVSGSGKGGATAHDTDKLMFAAYDIESSEVFGEVYGVSRRVGADRFEVPANRTATYHIYVAFVAADSSSRSNSLYLGTIDVG